MLKIARGLVIMPTYQCTASCNNCGTGSSPGRKEAIALDMMKRYMDEAAALDFRIVVFSGGEATLRWRDLISAIDIAKKHHLRTRLVTNAFWAKSPSCAEKKVDELRSVGLDEINITTGQQHLRFIPMQSVVNLIGCTVSRSMDTVVNLEAKTKMEGEIIKDSLSGQISHLNEKQKEQHLTVILSPWVNINNYSQPCYRICERNDWPTEAVGCDDILNTYTLCADGLITACCGLAMKHIPELLLGKEIPLQRAIEKAESDVVKIALRWLGPEKLLTMALNDAGKGPQRNHSHQCQSCVAFYHNEKARRWFSNNYQSIVEIIIENFIVDELIIPDMLDSNAKRLSRNASNPSTGESGRGQISWFPSYLIPSAAVWGKRPGGSFEGRYFLGSRGGR